MSSIIDSVMAFFPSNSLVVQEILPTVFQIVDKLNGNKNLALLSSLTLVGLISCRIYWTTFRVPPYLRGLPRVTAWQTIRSSIFNGGILDILDTQTVLIQKDAYKRGLIKSSHELPPIWTSWFLGQWIVTVANPTDFKDILTMHEKFEKISFEKMGLPLNWKLMGSNIVTDLTPEWNHHRKIVNPAFRRGWAISIFANPTRELIRYFDEFVASKSAVDVVNWMHRITLDALSTAAFGMNFDALNNPDSPLLTTYHRCMRGQFDPLTILLGRFAWILPRYRQCVRDIDEFNQLLFQLIDNKIKQIGNEGNSFRIDYDQEEKRDLLELMLLAQINNGESFTREDIRGNLVTFIIAGHDTTANALTFALYLLGLNLQVQEKVRKEVIDIMGDVDKDTSANDFPFPTHEQLNQLRYLTCVIKETLRIFPPILLLPMRMLMSDHTFASTGLHVPKGTGVSSSVWNLHRSQEYWGQDADQFRPERWESLDLENEGGIPLNPSSHNYTWVPFGGGQRICLGQQFSIIEQRVILSSLLLRYTWKVVGDAQALTGNPKSEAGILLNPTGIMLELTRRN